MEKIKQCINKYTFWKDAKPDRYERRKLPASCFLIPGERKFPICGSDGCIYCSGLLAAYRRAITLKYVYPPEVVEEVKRRAVGEALKLADPSDPRNICNFVLGRSEKEMARRTSRKMLPGECRTTRGGVQYCMIPGVGVRFQPSKGLSDVDAISGVYRHCVRYKMTPAGRRCAEYAPGPGFSDIGDTSTVGGVYRHCIRYKMTPAGRRCAEYAPGPR